MPSAPVELRDCPAPAKLNLFLHVVGRRPDGYHLLQTIFQLIDWNDTLHFARRPDRRLMRTTDILGVPVDGDLVIRVTRLLQAETDRTYGVDVAVEKRLPMGEGLGDGSSDTATTLLTLNRLWGFDLPCVQLIKIGLKLDADIPFFIFGQNAFAERIGEELTPVTLPPAVFVVIHPRAHMPTPTIFSDEGLTYDTPLTIITNFPDQQIVFAYGHSDLQTVAERKYGEIIRALV